MYQIANEYLSVSISAKGAELQSVVNKNTRLEYLWNGDPAFWGKKSPVLFPIVGGLKNNAYSFNGKEYTLGRHGFAREKEFKVRDHSSHSIHFFIDAGDDTLNDYPFLFRFSIIYTLDQNRINIIYQVQNTDFKTLFFSVGAHPAFAVPLVAGTGFTNHYLLFNEKETAGRWPLSPEGLIGKEPVSMLENSNILPLTKELFFGDALVFKHLKSTSISIRNHKNEHGIDVSFTDFPYVGIWSAKNADFVCIEPWCGIADSVDASGNLKEKEGINFLLAGELFMRNWSIKVF